MIDKRTGKFLVCADCVERLTKQIDKLFPGKGQRMQQLVREAVDCITEDIVRKVGLATVTRALDAKKRVG